MKSTHSTVILLGLTFSSFLQSEESHEKISKVAVGLGFRIDVDWSVPKSIESIPTLPLEFRQVPGHRDEGGAGVLREIPPDTLKPKNYAHLLFGVAPEVRFGKDLVFRAGIGYGGFVNAGPNKCSCGTTRETNNGYNGVNRGDYQARGADTSLVYYSVVRTASTKPSVFAEAQFKVKPQSFSWVLGALYSRDSVRVMRGWDRYDELTNWRSDTIGRYYNFRPYVGLRVDAADDVDRYSLMFYVGPTFNRYKPLPIGMGIDLFSNKKGVIFGVSMAYSRTLIRHFSK